MKLVVEALASRGIRAERTAVGRSRNWLKYEVEDGEALLFVTSRRTGDWQTDIRKGKPREPDEADLCFWVFVDLTTWQAKFFIAPEWWVQNDIHRDYQAYLERQGGTRAINPESTHHGIKVERIEQWRERWDLLPGLDYRDTGCKNQYRPR
jgi:hypothetical protein